MMMNEQVKSKERVMEHGEVYTREREVNAMLDLVKNETLRIDSRFLEPACGTGNFLIEVLRRKLNVVENKYKRSQLEYERYAFTAVSSLYGVDVLPDNIEICRNRLLYLLNDKYSAIFQSKTKPVFLKVIKYVLTCNIIHGDALSLTTMDKPPKPIVFSEWSFVKENYVKRRDYTYHELLSEDEDEELTLFANEQPKSDTGKKVFIPKPVRDYKPVHFLRITDV